MDLKSFEHQINELIVDRGYDYYLNKKVKNVSNSKNGEYIFQADGVELYDIFVKINSSGKILETDCSCPYNKGPYCKHQVAVFFELRNNLQNGNSETEEKQPTLTEVVSELSKEQLVELLLEAAKRDTVFADRIYLRFRGDISDDTLLVYYSNAFSSIVDSYSDAYGGIDYNEAYEFQIDIDNLMQEAMEIPNLLTQLDIATLFLVESVEVLYYADDSNGDIGYLIHASIEWIRDLTQQLTTTTASNKDKAFNTLLEVADKTAFDGWSDFRLDIYQIATLLANDEDRRKQLITALEKRIQKLKEKEVDSFEVEEFMAILFDVISQYETKEKVKHFFEENYLYRSVRKHAIETLIANQEYEEALRIALESESLDQEYPRWLMDWKELRYRIYRLQNRKKEQVEVGKELFLNGDFQYYYDIKELAEELQIEGFYQSLKADLKNQKHWQAGNIYLALIEEENDLSALLEFVRNNPYTIERYANRFSKEYDQQVIEIYQEHIRNEARHASNRKQYQKVCNVLRKFRRVAGSGKTTEIVNELRESYSNKPAFMDELSKV